MGNPDSVLAAPLIGAGGLGVPIRELLLIALVAAVVTYFATGVARVVAVRAGAVARPRERDVHVIVTPRWGGIGMFSGVVIALLLAQQLPALARGFEYTNDIRAMSMAAFVIVVVGVVDDRWGIDAWTKLAGQITAAGIMAMGGLSWYLIYVPFGDINTLVLDPLQATLMTVLVTVAIVNAMNFVDGLDGLAAGLGLIAASAICLFSMSMLATQGGTVSAYPPAMISAVLAGACIGFLPHNFNPARIFMGDSGSMLIGLMLAASSTSASGRIALNAYGPADMLALLSPILVVLAAMFIPFLDLLLAVVRRVRAGRSPFAPDKMHLHHRMLELGHSHRRVVLLIYMWVALLAFGAVAVPIVPAQVLVPTIAALLVAALLATIIPRIRRRMMLRGMSRHRRRVRAGEPRPRPRVPRSVS